MHQAPPTTLTGPTVCIAEDRDSCEPALRILVASLALHCPGLPVVLFSPQASNAFRGWLASFANVRLNPFVLDGAWTKYDIKPLALLTLLNAGADDVVWIDSDIVVARDFRPLFATLPHDTIAVTEEALGGGRTDPDALRARLWGMPVGRALPFTANTGVVRVTTAHRALVEAWHALLQSAPYRAAQDMPWYERPMHMAGDQEVLTALLASRDHAGIPIHFLRRGRDIVQFFGIYGYTVRERLGNLSRGMAYFIHSQGFRPWWPVERPAGGLGARLGYVYNALSPYTTLARRHADALTDRAWLATPSLPTRLMAWRHPALTGLPLALAIDLVRAARAVRQRAAGRGGVEPDQRS